MRKRIALILALVMIFSMIPMTAFAQEGSASYTRLTSVPGAEKGDTAVAAQPTAIVQDSEGRGNFGTARVEVTVPARSMRGAESLFINVPRGVQVGNWSITPTSNTYDGVTSGDAMIALFDSDSTTTIPANVDPTNADDHLTRLQGDVVNGRQDIEIIVTPFDSNTNVDEFKFVVELDDIYVGSNFSGSQLDFQFFGQGGTVFAGRRDVLSGNIGLGEVTVGIDEINFITDGEGADTQRIGVITIEESQAGAFDDPVRIKLPRGFYFDEEAQTRDNISIDRKYGNGTVERIEFDQPINGKPQRVNIFRGTASNSPTAWDITGLEIIVDPTMASYGEIEASVSNATPSTLVVGVYGDYLAEVSAESKPLRLAGKTNQRLGDFMIEELIGGTLVEGRTVTMTLPSGAKWVQEEISGTDVGFDGPNLDRSKSENFGTVSLVGEQVVDISGRVLRARVQGSSLQNDPASLYFEAPRVAISPDFQGDEIVVTFGGSAGVGGEIAMADVAKPVVPELVGDSSQLRIGVQGQEIGDILITEVKTAALSRGGLIQIEPVWNDVRFAKTPNAEVVGGDLIIEDIWTSASRDVINIRISADSDDEVGEIMVSDLEVSLDRTAPEGTMELEFSGTALMDNIIFAEDGYFPGAEVSTVLAVGDVVTAAPGELVDEERSVVAFTVGAMTYAVDGEMKPMDVPAYIDNNRIMVPVRYLEEMFGMQPNWNETSRTVTVLFEGDVFGMTIGSNMITRNGADFMEMDAMAEIRDARTFVPASRFARAMGIDFEWDGVDTATFK